ncbi:MAG: TonB-dependent receptor [Rikenellaceae bacterium]|nr:TonB-dependent receptor [Rikenellaceae bacterium]
MKKIFTLMVIGVLGVMSTFAARQMICSGRVVDGSGAPIAFATVILLEGSEQVAGMATEGDGSFTFTAPAGRYRLRVQYVGYEPLEREVEFPADSHLGDLLLKESATAIDEVVVKAQLIRREADRFVVDVANSPLAVGKDGVELLKTAPGVWMQEDGISINGSGGTKVYVNDRELKMEGTQLITYLRSLRAEEVQRVEVVPQSGADYDASSSAGIIRITLKRRRDDGLMGSASYNFTVGEYQAMHNPYLSLNYNSGGWNLYASGWMNLGNQDGVAEEQTDYLLRDMRLEARSDLHQENLYGGGKAGAIYDFNDRHSLGAEFEYWSNSEQSTTPSTTLIHNGDASDRNEGLFTSTSDRENFSASLSYIFRLDTLGSNLKVLSDYTHRTIGDGSDNETHKYRAAQVRDSLYRENTASRYDIFTATLALEQHLSPKWMLRAGAKYTRNETQNSALYRRFEGGEWLPNSVADYAIEYTENIGALYLIASGRFGRFSLTAGLRGEYTYTSGRGSSFEQNYCSLFPNAHLAWQLDKPGKHSLVASYSRTISRPNFWDLTPARQAISDYSYQTGNPELKPAFNNQYSLTLVMWHKYSLTAGINNQTDAISQVMVADPHEPEMLILTRQNMPDYNWYYVTLSAPAQFRKWWMWNTNLNYMCLGERMSPEAPIEYHGTFQWYTSMTFQLPHKFILECSYNGMTAMTISNVSVGARHSLNFSLKKRLLKDRLTLTLSANDVLGLKQEISASQPDFRRTYRVHQAWGDRCFSVGINYNFNAGKAFHSKSVERGSAEEQSRM